MPCRSWRTEDGVEEVEHVGFHQNQCDQQVDAEEDEPLRVVLGDGGERLVSTLFAQSCRSDGHGGADVGLRGRAAGTARRDAAGLKDVVALRRLECEADVLLD
jgi:hypothetical protein